MSYTVDVLTLGFFALWSGWSTSYSKMSSNIVGLILCLLPLILKVLNGLLYKGKNTRKGGMLWAGAELAATLALWSFLLIYISEPKLLGWDGRGSAGCYDSCGLYFLPFYGALPCCSIQVISCICRLVWSYTNEDEALIVQTI